MALVDFIEYYMASTGSVLNSGTTEDDVGQETTILNSDNNSNFVITGDSIDIEVDDLVSMFYYFEPDPDPEIQLVRITEINGSEYTYTKIFENPHSAFDGIDDLVASIRVGGRWKTPVDLDSVSFFVAGKDCRPLELNDRPPRLNVLSESLNSTIRLLSTNYLHIEGYTETPGDGGIVTIDFGESLDIANTSVYNGSISNFIFKRNDATQDAGCLFLDNSFARRVAISGFGGYGIYSSNHSVAIECEVYNCDRYSGNSYSFIVGDFSNKGIAIRCISHHNNGSGFIINNGCCIDCISYENGENGFETESTNFLFKNCDAYKNELNGFLISNYNGVFDSCNTLANEEAGIVFHLGSGQFNVAQIINCGFGRGTMANPDGDVIVDSDSPSVHPISQSVIDPIIYPDNETPWEDPDNGNFTISLTEAIGVGRGFFQTAEGQSGTTPSYDIGAAQSGGAGSVGFAPGPTIIGNSNFLRIGSLIDNTVIVKHNYKKSDDD